MQTLLEIPPDYVGPYIGSNVVSVGLIVIAAKWPRVSKWLFFLIFLAAGIVNSFTATREPSMYVEVYGPLTLLEIYRDFIYGFFSQYTRAIVLAIAAGQLVVAAFLAGKGRWFQLGVVGGIVFLLAIAPLGVGSAFPATLLMAVALYVTLRRLT